MSPTDAQRAWAAGLFDGEGWASSARYNRKRGGMTSSPVVGVGQNDPEVLERFQKIVSVGRVNGPDARGMYAFKAHGLEKVEHVAELLWPWLGSRKREQLSRVLGDAREHARRQPKRMFTEDEVLAILDRLAGGESQAEIARSIGCEKQRINAIARGRSYKGVPRR